MSNPRPVSIVMVEDDEGHARLIEKNIRARDIVTLKALENAARVVGCTGGSTNAALHLPALANEAGIDFDLFDVAKIMKDTPYFVDLKPGEWVIQNVANSAVGRLLIVQAHQRGLQL